MTRRGTIVRPALLLLPAAAVLVLGFGAGLGLALAQSLGWFPAAGLRELSLAAYRDLAASPRFWRAAAESLTIALTATTLAALSALAIAVALRPMLRHPAVRLALRVPLLVPHLGVAAVVLLLLGQSGLLSRLAFALGWLSDPAQFPELVYDRWSVGLITMYVYKETPFIALFLFALLERIGGDYDAVARSLGANAWQRFWRVLLPMLLPGLTAASVIVFAFVFGAFEFPLLLARTHPETLPVLAWHAYADVDLAARPRAMAVSVLIALGAVLAGVATLRLLRRLRDY